MRSSSASGAKQLVHSGRGGPGFIDARGQWGGQDSFAGGAPSEVANDLDGKAMKTRITSLVANWIACVASFITVTPMQRETSDPPCSSLSFFFAVSRLTHEGAWLTECISNSRRRDSILESMRHIRDCSLAVLFALVTPIHGSVTCEASDLSLFTAAVTELDRIEAEVTQVPPLNVKEIADYQAKYRAVFEVARRALLANDARNERAEGLVQLNARAVRIAQRVYEPGVLTTQIDLKTKLAPAKTMGQKILQTMNGIKGAEVRTKGTIQTRSAPKFKLIEDQDVGNFLLTKEGDVFGVNRLTSLRRELNGTKRASPVEIEDFSRAQIRKQLLQDLSSAVDVEILKTGPKQESAFALVRGQSLDEAQRNLSKSDIRRLVELKIQVLQSESLLRYWENLDQIALKYDLSP